MTNPPPREGPPVEVVEAFGLGGATFEPIDVGLINRTYRVRVDGRPKFVLQRLHEIFRGEVNLDLEAIAAYLAGRGIGVPALVRTVAGAAWHDHEGRAWRLLDHLDGVTFTRVTRPSLARAAASLVGRFHAALDGFSHTFHFTRPGAHDTSAHLARLSKALDVHGTRSSMGAVRPVAEAILGHALPTLPVLPTRIIHGDLKISNVLFAEHADPGGARGADPDGARGADPDADEAVALLDLDTFQHGNVAIELGDALRSWCNLAGESAADVDVDVEVFRAAVEGYATHARALLGPVEVESLVGGLETIALELSSRFALDALEDRYFGWDPTRYPHRSAHNLARAGSQLALARSVAARRQELSAIVGRAFG